jgi:hypothetical protein
VDPGVLAAIVTASGALAVAIVGYWLNRRMGLPSNFQKTIREERKLYEQVLERKVQRLEGELEAERKDREAVKKECIARINRLADDLVDKELLIDRLRARVTALEAEAPQ